MMFNEKVPTPLSVQEIPKFTSGVYELLNFFKQYPNYIFTREVLHRICLPNISIESVTLYLNNLRKLTEITQEPYRVIRKTHCYYCPNLDFDPGLLSEKLGPSAVLKGNEITCHMHRGTVHLAFIGQNAIRYAELYKSHESIYPVKNGFLYAVTQLAARYLYEMLVAGSDGVSRSHLIMRIFYPEDIPLESLAPLLEKMKESDISHFDDTLAKIRKQLPDFLRITHLSKSALPQGNGKNKESRYTVKFSY